MRTFKDNAGRTWSVSVDVNAIRRVRTALQVNLVGSDFVKVLEGLVSDPILLCDVIYILCKPEADAQKITDEEFGRAMAGDAIEHATKAFLDELANFTPNPRDRARVQRVINAMWNLAEKARDATDKTIDEEIAKLEATVISSLSSSDSPAPSALTPDP